jgi:CRISPR-associated protein Cmr2
VPGRLAGRLRSSERLSAPGLVKRFAYGAFFRNLVRVDFQDTREVAFGDWVARLRATPHGVLHWNNWHQTVAGINRRSADETDQRWADHDLLDEGSMVAAHWVHADADEKSQGTELKKARSERAKLVARGTSAGLPDPRPYYAVLVADGDNMGAILRGEKGPRFDQAYHPLMLAKLREIGLSSQVLSGVRPQGMAAQLAFSRHLGEFTRQASDTITKHRGTCVYAGGDDVLAVLPVANALTAAADLAQDFATYVPGATLSAGLAIVHCQEDLRVAIEAARGAEQLAKQSGKNCLGCAIVRRSGDTNQAVTAWPLVRDWQRASGLLADRSDRWVHHLLSERDTLRHLPAEAVWARIRHLLLHGEEGGRVGKDLGGLFDRIRAAWGDFAADRERGFDDATRIDQFLTWCQHAAWLARFQMTDKAQP